jgi:hypothetical protein
MPEDMLTPDQKAVQKLTPNDKPAPDAAQRKQRRLDRMKQRTVLSDCVVMLRYALDESCRLPTALIDDIAKIDAILVAARDEPLSERPESLLKSKPQPPKTSAEDAKPQDAVAAPPPAPAQAQPQAPQQPEAAKAEAEAAKAQPETQGTDSVDQLLLRIHNGLSDLVAPATALSLRATDPDIVLWGLPWIAQFAIIGALISTVLFILAVPKPQPATTQKSAAGSATASVSPATASTPGTTATPSP